MSAIRKAERRGFWRGAIGMLALWLITDLLEPTFWLAMLIALAIGAGGGALVAWIDHRHPLPDEVHDQ